VLDDAGYLEREDEHSASILRRNEESLPMLRGRERLAVARTYFRIQKSALEEKCHDQDGVMAFVVSGTIVSKVGDGPERAFRSGESWWEPPGAIHRVSHNGKPHGASDVARYLHCSQRRDGGRADETDMSVK
jgi:quercetin dioxygenase-like cupin family protein